MATATLTSVTPSQLPPPVTSGTAVAGAAAAMTTAAESAAHLATKSTMPTTSTTKRRPSVTEADGASTQALRDAWIECHADDRVAGVETHPSVAMSRSEFGDAIPLIYTNWSTDDDSKISSLGVLEADTVKARVLVGLPWRLKCHGRLLVGSALVGDASDAAIQTFFDALTELFRSRRADSLTIEDADIESPLYKALPDLRRRGLTHFCSRVPEARSFIDFPEKPEDYWKKISNKTRKRVRKQGQNLKTTLVHYRKPEEVGEFLKKASAICAKSWQGLTLGRRIGDDPKTCAYWRRIAELGAMRSYTLEIDGTPIAFQRSYQWNGQLNLNQTGYDPVYHPHSPGTLMMHQIIDDLIADNTPKRVDFGHGDFPYKRYFGTSLTTTVPLVIIPRRARPLMIKYASRLDRDLHRGVRAALERFNLFSKVKNKLYRNRATGQ